jgi:hypothetical protein
MLIENTSSSLRSSSVSGRRVVMCTASSSPRGERMYSTVRSGSKKLLRALSARCTSSESSGTPIASTGWPRNWAKRPEPATTVVGPCPATPDCAHSTPSSGACSSEQIWISTPLEKRPTACTASRLDAAPMISSSPRRLASMVQICWYERSAAASAVISRDEVSSDLAL